MNGAGEITPQKTSVSEELQGCVGTDDVSDKTQKTGWANVVENDDKHS